MDFTTWISTYWKEVLLAGSSVFEVLTGCVFLIRTHILSKSLAAAKNRGTYTVCPHCKQALRLDELDLYLPGGHKDNNLNGVPDDKEGGSR